MRLSGTYRTLTFIYSSNIYLLSMYYILRGAIAVKSTKLRAFLVCVTCFTTGERFAIQDQETWRAKSKGGPTAGLLCGWSEVSALWELCPDWKTDGTRSKNKDHSFDQHECQQQPVSHDHHHSVQAGEIQLDANVPTSHRGGLGMCSQ